MDIIFRTDASLKIGSGHVMRCLTLAGELRDRGANCRFICRDHPGNLLTLIEQSGFKVYALPTADAVAVRQGKSGGLQTEYGAWLGTDWQNDAAQAVEALGDGTVDWLVVDHYALGIQWERALRETCHNLLVIDDLGREHDCDILLDQNVLEDIDVPYRDRIPEACRLLLGPEFALVRPEFERLREYSLARRATPACERLLVFMSGSDEQNETARVIEGIMLSNRKWNHIDVVVGNAYQAVDTLRDRLELLPSTTLHIQTSDMAGLMADADLAVTAGGTVTWEKCVLGLPSLVTILSDNQRSNAEMMHGLGALYRLGPAINLSPYDYAAKLDSIQTADLQSMSNKARVICDGAGIHKIGNILETYHEH